jgi:hypothetical protein
MTEDLDPYRPPDYDHPTNPYSRWAFYRLPQAEEGDDGWTAWNPGADWSVSASSKEEALQLLREEMEHRMRAGDKYGDYLIAYSKDVDRRHLEQPIRGVYAMDIGLYNHLRETESRDDIARAFAEAEEQRVAGQPYTMDDYRRNRAKDKAAESD